MSLGTLAVRGLISIRGVLHMDAVVRRGISVDEVTDVFQINPLALGDSRTELALTFFHCRGAQV